MKARWSSLSGQGLLPHLPVQAGAPAQAPLQRGGPSSLERGLQSHGKSSLLWCLGVKGLGVPRQRGEVLPCSKR